MRFLHVSDLHIDGGVGAIPLSAFANKRFVGWLNLRLRRARYYADAPQKIDLLGEFMREESIDVVLCSGDYTALGTASELHYARRTIEPLTRAPRGFVTVPGNHDVYLDDAVGLFEKEFGAFLQSDLPDACVEGRWPLVRFFDEVAVVCVDSCRPNPPVFRSSGRVPDAQIAALAEVLRHPEVAKRFVLVMTHYAPRLVSGKPDTPSHGLENADELLATCAVIQRGALIHGHVHKCFTVDVPECRIPIFGAGSTTQAGHEGLWVFDVDGEGARARRGRFTAGRYRLDPTPAKSWAQR